VAKKALTDTVVEQQTLSKSLDAKYDSLKAFEEQLLTKEALVQKRAELQDLKEQGIKLK